MKKRALVSMLSLLTLQISWTDALLAYEYHGRMLLGGYLAKEHISDRTENSSNDAAAVSSRFYLDVSKITDENYQATIDLRDKNDFFDKLDREKFQLTNQNEFQVRQLFLRRPPQETGFYGTVGRFLVPEAGSVYADGAELGRKWNPRWSSSFFGGLNAKRPEQTYLTFNSDSYAYGAYLLYQSPHDDWTQNLYITNAITVNQVKSDVDRIFWYQHLMYQPSPRDRLYGLFYLDFVPRVYLQNLYFNYFHEITSSISGELGATVFDALEYQRRQGVRERLAASPYREGNLQMHFDTSESSTLTAVTAHGLRSADKKWKHEYSLTGYTSSLFGPQFSGQLTFGFQNHFVSNDYFARTVLGFYSQAWEINWTEYAAYEKYESTQTLIPIVSELNLSHFFYKDFFLSVSAEYAWDSQAQHMSGFFKLGYHFGSRDTPAVRNAAHLGRAI